MIVKFVRFHHLKVTVVESNNNDKLSKMPADYLLFI